MVTSQKFSDLKLRMLAVSNRAGSSKCLQDRGRKSSANLNWHVAVFLA